MTEKQMFEYIAQIEDEFYQTSEYWYDDNKSNEFVLSHLMAKTGLTKHKCEIVMMYYDDSIQQDWIKRVANSEEQAASLRLCWY